LARTKPGFWFWFAVVVLKPLLLLVTGRDWRHRERVPRQGGVVVATNHNSHIDPLVVAHFLWDLKRPVRFLAKASVFDVPFVGMVVRGAKQIPVYRETVDAGASVRAAVAAVERGECVVVYPEGTLTRDPGLWPVTLVLLAHLVLGIAIAMLDAWRNGFGYGAVALGLIGASSLASWWRDARQRRFGPTSWTLLGCGVLGAACAMLADRYAWV